MLNRQFLAYLSATDSLIPTRDTITIIINSIQHRMNMRIISIVVTGNQELCIILFIRLSIREARVRYSVWSVAYPPTFAL